MLKLRIALIPQDGIALVSGTYVNSKNAIRNLIITLA
jgi:hypothetical protein